MLPPSKPAPLPQENRLFILGPHSSSSPSPDFPAFSLPLPLSIGFNLCTASYIPIPTPSPIPIPSSLIPILSHPIHVPSLLSSCPVPCPLSSPCLLFLSLPSSPIYVMLSCRYVYVIMSCHYVIQYTTN